MKVEGSMYKLGLLLAIFAALAVTTSIHADPLNLEVPHDPWICTDGVFVQYSLTGETTGHLWAYGAPTTYNDAPESTVALDSRYSWFELNVDLTTDGVATGGSLTLSGAVDIDPASTIGDIPQPPVLFNSTVLTDFGFGQEDMFEFLFVQDGDAVPPDNEPFGVVLFGTSIPGEPADWFSADFNNYYNGQANVFYLPEPASFCLLALGGLGLIRRRK